jgi:DNA uptake protein ComE-like DNA-binding protein
MVLLVLCLIAAGWVTYEQWIRPATVEDAVDLHLTWWRMQDSIKVKEKEYRHQGRKHERIQLFAFDPNHLPTEQWMQLGLSERQAGAIHHYEEHGGKFRVKADVARMHVVDADLFAQWRPYIQLPDSLPRRQWKTFAARSFSPRDSASGPGGKSFAREDRNRVVELNSADSTALVTVRGIGPSFARAIIRYRDRLGGFVSLDQLNEVYILRDKPDAVERIRQQLTLDLGLVKMIHLNSCTVEDLGPHPYAGWKLAKVLVAYRQQHGPFPNVDGITGCVLVTDSMRDRLAPYLTLE